MYEWKQNVFRNVKKTQENFFFVVLQTLNKTGYKLVKSFEEFVSL